MIVLVDSFEEIRFLKSEIPEGGLFVHLENTKFTLLVLAPFQNHGRNMKHVDVPIEI